MVEEASRMFGAFVIGMLVVIVYGRIGDWVGGVVQRVGNVRV